MNRNFTLEYKNPLLEDDCVRLQRHLEENAFRAITIFLVHMVLCPVVLLGNAAILLTIWKTPSLHTPAYMLLANLAVSDFATGLLLQPFVITIVLSASFGVSPSTFRFLCAGFGVNNNSPIQYYVHPDDQTQPTFEMTPGFKPFTK